MIDLFLTNIYGLVTPQELMFVMGVAFLAGLIKGVVGFGMPMICMAGFSFVLPPEIALAALILPTFLANVQQILRFKWQEIVITIKDFKIFLLSGMVMMVMSAQLVMQLNEQFLFLFIGIPVTVFSAMQLRGLSLNLKRPNLKWDIGVGSFAGFIGGLSGIWGPPTVMYLNFLSMAKREHIRTQGVVYGLGTVSLLMSHLYSGVFRSQTALLSAALVLPAVMGMSIGTYLQDRLDQNKFKKLVLYVLALTGLNLVRRGLF